ncbi:PhzF family phenazine biosynthesis isomerase [Sulfurimonas aquatica]|uniref:PhzF family phenazine biosynthesis isomerase n=1 Tax=Sulfurimonas aquatica TaxID=2672570 RepID=A0A975GBY8_9BACT|nr:PhzF family phenazine biosynthesis protein [Sulfurimonas aquatica]QSZ41181.1 PhzF family phenazine biosynthesis isomerase [Sulfurimonas aquatica]
MKIKFYQVDAFANSAFEGNPAAISPLDEWLDDEVMQKIAMENNLSETAFFVKTDDVYELRWFTPKKEVNLCGHATLASAYVIFNYLDYEKESIVFHSKSGPLYVSKLNNLIRLDFPSEAPIECETPKEIIEAFSEVPVQVLKATDYIVVYKDGTDLTKFKPDLQALKNLDLRGVCITTIHNKYDFVSRFFAPNYGIDEDSVTGSAYTQLTPYWAKIMNKTTFTSKQLSSRGGELKCELDGDRVYISGKAVCCIVGEMTI